ncbi:hypothetical protein PNA2_0968 [Pyrococcus sp. NA2]|uniref:hypothetical protein n=1 Tax=Pyrococcus sp. (strain NA2) TaxID=342949 RepID=UPI000209A97E|nr:hypothetical protein [Pyrococcus sp. NA2]AEC51884.1 hypothetical protein PNA2_0968 [Pyrococcus sp. NA2]
MERELVRYYMFTIPHVTIFSGAIFGLLLLMKVNTKLASGLFATLYGFLLTILALIVRQHFWNSTLYRISLITFISLFAAGILITLMSI